MKIKKSLFSLTIFVLLQITLMSVIESPHKHSMKTKLDNHSPKYSTIHPDKHLTVYPGKHSTVNPERTTLENKNIKNFNPKDGFFQNQSKKNQSMAGKALAAFVSGLILFIVSIHLICWNERRAVKDTEFTDFIRSEKKCVVLENGKEPTKEEEGKVHLVSGLLTVTEEAKINNLRLNIESSKGKILVIKTHYEYFSKDVVNNKKEVGEDEEGNTLVENEQVTHRNWNNSIYEKGNIFHTDYHYGKALIAGKYSFPMKNLDKFVEMNQTKMLVDNKYIYRPTPEDLNTLEEYFQSGNTNDNQKFKIIIKDPWIFILRSGTNVEDIDPDTYEFAESDIRLTIKYFYSPETDCHYTAVGSSSQAKEDGIREISSYKTDLYMAGCSYFCCCCADDDSKYEVDLVYTTRMSRDAIVSELEAQNKNATCCLRLLGFIVHFLAYYLILYPIIMLVGMIPFLGAIGATILILIAFILALMTFLFIIACAWICARPVYAVLIFGAIFIMMFVSKSAAENIRVHNENQNGNYDKGGNNWPHRKFLH